MAEPNTSLGFMVNGLEFSVWVSELSGHLSMQGYEGSNVDSHPGFCVWRGDLPRSMAKCFTEI